jgi:hypothetical protein
MATGVLDLLVLLKMDPQNNQGLCRSAAVEEAGRFLTANYPCYFRNLATFLLFHP